MLILTRRLNETVMIGDDVTVTVLGVKGGQVRIGINAPKDVAVHREEVYERIKNEQQSMLRTASPTPGPQAQGRKMAEPQVRSGCAVRAAAQDGATLGDAWPSRG